MLLDLARKLSRPGFVELSKQLLETLKKGAGQEYFPRILGLLFQHLRIQEVKSRQGPSGTLFPQIVERALAAYLGLEVSRKLPQLLRLHEALVEGGLGHKCAYEFGRDVRLYALKNNVFTVGSSSVEMVVKAFVIEEPAGGYVLVFNQHQQNQVWSFHIRRFWPARQKTVGRGPLPRAADYADDIKRPSLGSFENGLLIAGIHGSGPGLRYGDLRDGGFIISVLLDHEEDTQLGPEADPQLAKIWQIVDAAQSGLEQEARERA